MVINLKDIPRITEILNASYAENGPDLDVQLQKYTGPDTGLVYDEKTGVVSIASEWAPMLNGDIVKICDHTGPATGNMLIDGVIQPVKPNPLAD